MIVEVHDCHEAREVSARHVASETRVLTPPRRCCSVTSMSGGGRNVTCWREELRTTSCVGGHCDRGPWSAASGRCECVVVRTAMTMSSALRPSCAGCLVSAGGGDDAGSNPRSAALTERDERSKPSTANYRRKLQRGVPKAVGRLRLRPMGRGLRAGEAVLRRVSSSVFHELWDWHVKDRRLQWA